MDIKKVTEDFYVCGQVSSEDMLDITALGIASIINNRPDGEVNDQPLSETLGGAAETHGLGYSELPITPGVMTETEITGFSTWYKNSTGPRLAFCRTGTRSITLWALSQVKTLGVEYVLSSAANIGYDLSSQRSRLEGLAQF